MNTNFIAISNFLDDALMYFDDMDLKINPTIKFLYETIGNCIDFCEKLKENEC